MTNPSHLDGESIRKFDFIVSNPPFNSDFSADVMAMNSDAYGRFFAGVPKIPDGEKSKKKMLIYLPFLQHIIESLSDKGKAAVVVPEGFLSSEKKIAKEIKKKLISQNWLRGVVLMPSNIFATTGTNVGIIFIDKTRNSEDIIFVDASNLGTSVSLDEGQRTILSDMDTSKIISTFMNMSEEDGFSVIVPRSDIEKKKYSFFPGYYFPMKLQRDELTKEEFTWIVEDFKKKMIDFRLKARSLDDDIIKEMEKLVYDE